MMECSKNEISEKRKKKDLEKFQTNFSTKFPAFEYLSGYNGCDSVIEIKCRVCNRILKRSAQCARRNKVLECECCTTRKSNERINLNQKNREQKKVMRKLLASLKKQTAKLKRDHKLDSPLSCKQCGDQFKPDNFHRKKYCSLSCYKRYSNKLRELKRETRLKQNGPIDYSISLEKLIKKYDSVCALCNSKVIKSTDVQSSMYPSIDHIVPVSKGGTHTWDNVQLAHRGCNNTKLNKTFVVMQNGQLLLNL